MTTSIYDNAIWILNNLKAFWHDLKVDENGFVSWKNLDKTKSRWRVIRYDDLESNAEIFTEDTFSQRVRAAYTPLNRSNVIINTLINKKNIIKETIVRSAVMSSEHFAVFYGLTNNEEENEIYSVIEYFPKGTLYDYLSEQIVELTTFAKRNMALKITSGLKYLHGKGMLHFFLNHDVIEIRENDEPVFTHFGIPSRCHSDVAVIDSNYNADVSGVPVKIFVPPEQVGENKSTYTTACDIYSLGVMIWEIFNVQTPSKIDNLFALMMIGVGQEDVKKAHKTYEKCLNLNPQARPNIDEVIKDLYEMEVDSIYDPTTGDNVQIKQEPEQDKAPTRNKRKLEPNYDDELYQSTQQPRQKKQRKSITFKHNVTPTKRTTRATSRKREKTPYPHTPTDDHNDADDEREESLSVVALQKLEQISQEISKGCMRNVKGHKITEQQYIAIQAKKSIGLIMPIISTLGLVLNQVSSYFTDVEMT
jgi:serine/threonine protein kinase